MRDLIPLGTNGFYPSYGRATMSFLVLEGERALLLDAGSGTARLGEAAIARRLASVAHLDVVLTHYHLDHVIGLSYLPGVWRGRSVRIHGPAPPLVEGEPRGALGQLLAPPLFPQTTECWPLRLEIRAYRDTAELEHLGWDLAVRPQQHAGGSVGLRLGDHLAYITDTVCDPATADFVRGVDMLLHECWWSDDELAASPNAGGHSNVSGVAQIARAARVKALAPIHHRPDRDPEALAIHIQALRSAANPITVVQLVEGEVFAPTT